MLLKKVAFIVVFLCLTAVYTHADIGENFEQSGLIISGSFGLYQDFGRLFDSTSDYNYTRIYLYPSIDFFVVNNLSIGLFGGISWTNSTDTDGTENGDEFDGSVGISFYKYLVSDPNADKGLVPSIGVALEFVFDPPTDSYTASRVFMNIIPAAQFNFFTNDRFAPFVRLFTTLGMRISWVDQFDNPIDYEFFDYMYLNLGLSLGFSYYIPNKKKLQL